MQHWLTAAGDDDDVIIAGPPNESNVREREQIESKQASSEEKKVEK